MVLTKAFFIKIRSKKTFAKFNYLEIRTDTRIRGLWHLNLTGNQLWIGLRDGGILCFDIVKRKFIEAPEELEKQSITTITATQAGDMLVGTFGDGFWIVTRTEEGLFKSLRLDQTSETRLNNVTAITFINEKKVFVAAEFQNNFFCDDDDRWLDCRSQPPVDRSCSNSNSFGKL